MNKQTKNKTTLKLRTLHPSIHVIAAIALFALSTFLATQAEIFAWEESLFLSIYNWPDLLRPIFIFVTWFGSIQVFGLFLLFFIFLKKFNIAVRFTMVSAMTYFLAGVGKSLWGRTRPDELLGVVARDFSYGPGYPSGHTALAVAMAFVAGHYLPKKYQWLPVVWIAGVALSRVYLGVHAPLDIVGGFAIGWFSYMLVRHVRLQPIKYSKKSNKTKNRK